MQMGNKRGLNNLIFFLVFLSFMGSAFAYDPPANTYPWEYGQSRWRETNNVIEVSYKDRTGGSYEVNLVDVHQCVAAIYLDQLYSDDEGEIWIGGEKACDDSGSCSCPGCDDRDSAAECTSERDLSLYIPGGWSSEGEYHAFDPSTTFKFVAHDKCGGEVGGGPVFKIGITSDGDHSEGCCKYWIGYGGGDAGTDGTSTGTSSVAIANPPENSGRWIWDEEVGKCCGDDFGITDEDNPDWSETSCKACYYGGDIAKDESWISKRVWVPEIHKCCGDDYGSTNPDEMDDPDWTEETCIGCVSGINNPAEKDSGTRVWSEDVAGAAENKGCCGDDEEDCALQVPSSETGSTYLCAMDGEDKPRDWFGTQDHMGDIIYLGCNNYEYVAAEDGWVSCEANTGNILATVNDHEYLCNGTGFRNTLECSGTGAFNSGALGGGKRYHKFESVAVGNQTYYCSEYSDWVTDLDEIYGMGDTDGSTCDHAEYPNMTGAPFDFTTTLCCGDDLLETYSDYAEEGDACYKGQIVHSCSNVMENESLTDPRIYPENGTLYVCGNATIEGGLVKPDDIGEPKEHCETICERGIAQFCSFDRDKWKSTGSALRNTASTWPGAIDNGSIQTECCEPSKCWNGTSCVGDQSNNPRSQPYSGYRCVNGTWEGAPTKRMPNGDEGYCPAASMCLWNRYGNYSDNGNPYGNPQCLNDGQHIDDYYCSSGEWTTRTRMLAEQLLGLVEFSGSDYLLECGPAEETLNNLKYYSATNTYVENYFNYGRINNVCVLNYEGHVVVGLSLNIDVNATPYSPLELFSKPREYCQGMSGEQFKACNDDPSVLYDEELNALISGTTSIVFGESYEAYEIGQPISVMLEAAKAQYHHNPYDYGIMDRARFLDRLYFARKGAKTVQAVLEAPERDEAFIAIEMLGFDGSDMANTCNSIRKYEAKTSPVAGHINCSDEMIVTKDFSLNYVGENFQARPIWKDLTAKLKI